MTDEEAGRAQRAVCFGAADLQDGIGRVIWKSSNSLPWSGFVRGPVLRFDAESWTRTSIQAELTEPASAGMTSFDGFSGKKVRWGQRKPPTDGARFVGWTGRPVWMSGGDVGEIVLGFAEVCSKIRIRSVAHAPRYQQSLPKVTRLPEVGVQLNC